MPSVSELLEPSAPVTVADVYPEPLRPTGSTVIKPLDSRALPSVIADWAASLRNMNAPMEFLATAALVACAGAVGNRVIMLPDAEANPTWKLALNLWGIIVGPPSSGKSPALEAAFAPVDDIDGKLFQEFLDNSAAYEKEKEQARLEKRAPECEAPVETSLVAQDVTPEKLAELLAANPYGLVSVQDELLALLAQWDKPDRAGERPFYLKLWNGTSSNKRQRVKGSSRAPIATLSLIGGTQPGKLAAYLKEALAGYGNDGLLVRFGLFVVANSKPWQRIVPTAAEEHTQEQARIAYANTVLWLHNLDANLPHLPKLTIKQGVTRPHLKFDSEAQEGFTEFQRGNYDESKTATELQASILNKQPAVLAKLAALIQLMEQPGHLVGIGAFNKALVLTEYYAEHMQAALGDVLEPTNSGLGSLWALLMERKTSATFNYERFTDRNLYRLGRAGLKDAKQVAAVLEEALELNWLLKDGNAFKPNPRIWDGGTNDKV